MSRFFSSKFEHLEPYVPGEQPKSTGMIKLNTNESPFPPPAAVAEAAARESRRVNLYCDPDCTQLRRTVADRLHLAPEKVLPVNGSDEALYFIFLAFGDSAHPFAFADITYGFYPVFAAVTGTPAHIIPLREDFSLAPVDYKGLGENIVIANPNAPTGMALARGEIESILRSNPDNIVVVDEAYVDFGGESCIPLLDRYDNLLVVQTCSKSRSLAGARLGFAFGSEALIADLNTIRSSINPYNVNRMTQAIGIASFAAEDDRVANCQVIMENRAYTADELEKLGFRVLPSLANFLFVSHPACPARELYEALRARGILVRWFNRPRIDNWLRITVGDRQQMDALQAALKIILKERGI